MRNFGIMSDRISLGGMSTDPAADSADTRAELLLSADAPFPRGYLAQAMFDVLTLCVWALIGCIAVLIVGGPLLALGWILFFS